MFYCEKKIFYLALYQQGEKTGQVGFASVSVGKDEVSINLQVKKMSDYLKGEEISGGYPLFLAVAGIKISLDKMEFVKGNGTFERRFLLKQDEITIENHRISPEKIMGVWVELDESGGLQVRGGEVDSQKIPEVQMPEQNMQEVQTAELEPQRDIAPLQEIFSANKWEQLLKQFKKIHPFGDDRVFICIEPKDFIILQEKYQKLVNNSFLLHGFYNYRYLILGEDDQLGEEGKTCYYLGVPGVFFEREKMVAVMFGFEGFESDGAVEIGKFGYYMRRVEL